MVIETTFNTGFPTWFPYKHGQAIFNMQYYLVVSDKMTGNLCHYDTELLNNWHIKQRFYCVCQRGYIKNCLRMFIWEPPVNSSKRSYVDYCRDYSELVI